MMYNWLQKMACYKVQQPVIGIHAQQSFTLLLNECQLLFNYYNVYEAALF